MVYFETAQKILNAVQFPKRKAEWTQGLKVIESSIKRQLQSVSKAYKPCVVVCTYLCVCLLVCMYLRICEPIYRLKSDNDNVYHDVVPKSIDMVTKPDAVFTIKLENYSGFSEL